MSNGDGYDSGKGSGGMGVDLANSVELILESHKAVQDLLAAFENVGGVQPLSDVVKRAEVTRRRFQEIGVELTKVIKEVKKKSDSADSHGGSAQHIHLHFHF